MRQGLWQQFRPNTWTAMRPHWQPRRTHNQTPRPKKFDWFLKGWKFLQDIRLNFPQLIR